MRPRRFPRKPITHRSLHAPTVLWFTPLDANNQPVEAARTKITCPSVMLGGGIRFTTIELPQP